MKLYTMRSFEIANAISKHPAKRGGGFAACAAVNTARASLWLAEPPKAALQTTALFAIAGSIICTNLFVSSLTSVEKYAILYITNFFKGEIHIKYSIMFVCHGNICRSPTAEFIMKDLVGKKLPEADILIASSATSAEELGNPVYPPARAELEKHGLSCAGKYAVQLKKSDYDRYDLFVIMDENNRRNIMRIFRSDPLGKVRKLLEFTGSSGDIDDPWYTGRFDAVYSEIYDGCSGLLNYIENIGRN